MKILISSQAILDYLPGEIQVRALGLEGHSPPQPGVQAGFQEQGGFLVHIWGDSEDIQICPCTLEECPGFHQLEQRWTDVL